LPTLSHDGYFTQILENQPEANFTITIFRLSMQANPYQRSLNKKEMVIAKLKDVSLSSVNSRYRD
jgi:hypothetical protein